jgi:hypothetical protein
MIKSDKIREYFRKHPGADVAKVAAKFGASKPMTYKMRKQVQDEWNPPAPLPMPKVDTEAPELGRMATEISALDVQVAGNHYKDQPIQPVEYIHANGIGYFEGNVIKYVSRWRKKNGIADLEKAKHYIELLIELEQRGTK